MMGLPGPPAHVEIFDYADPHQHIAKVAAPFPGNSESVDVFARVVTATLRKHYDLGPLFLSISYAV